MIILGAPRSGTNLLRDLLCGTRGVETWPCDEINYLWRHGDPGREVDHYSAADATPATAHFLRMCFVRQARRSRAEVLIEKTCANCLRVEFIAKVFPEAKFLVIYRDGRDAVASSMLRWKGGFNARYVLRKARYVPLVDAAFYAKRFLGDRVHQALSSDRRVRSWGPRFHGLDQLLRSQPLPAVCAEQWSQCVDAVDRDMALVDPSRVYQFSYESLVRDTESQMARLGKFLGRRLSPPRICVSQASIGGWRRKLDAETLATVLPCIEPTLARLGYLDAETQAA